MWVRCSPPCWKETYLLSGVPEKKSVVGGCTGRAFVQRVLGAVGEANQRVQQSRSPPHSRAQHCATRLGRNITRESCSCRASAAWGLGDQCHPSWCFSVVWELLQFLTNAVCQTRIGCGWPWERCAVPCPGTPCAFARPVPRCLAGSVRRE